MFSFFFATLNLAGVHLIFPRTSNLACQTSEVWPQLRNFFTHMGGSPSEKTVINPNHVHPGTPPCQCPTHQMVGLACSTWHPSHFHPPWVLKDATTWKAGGWSSLCIRHRYVSPGKRKKKGRWLQLDSMCWVWKLRRGHTLKKWPESCPDNPTQC